jgi:hypothetical protein
VPQPIFPAPDAPDFKFIAGLDRVFATKVQREHNPAILGNGSLHGSSISGQLLPIPVR